MVKKRLLCFLLGIGLLLGGCGSAVPRQQPEQKEKQPVEISPEENYRTWYEVFVYSFFDGIGDFNGLMQKLDYINDGNPETTTDLGCSGIC